MQNLPWALVVLAFFANEKPFVKAYHACYTPAPSNSQATVPWFLLAVSSLSVVWKASIAAA